MVTEPLRLVEKEPEIQLYELINRKEKLDPKFKT